MNKDPIIDIGTQITEFREDKAKGKYTWNDDNAKSVKKEWPKNRTQAPRKGMAFITALTLRYPRVLTFSLGGEGLGWGSNETQWEFISVRMRQKQSTKNRNINDKEKNKKIYSS